MLLLSVRMTNTDDKHSVKVGEPGFPVAAGKQVLDPPFCVSDHDFTKESLFPTVNLLCKVPESITIQALFS